ncbi:MbnP family copper-binding protein [Alcanivorax sp. 24]|uniref:MbnP family copper-binding protein n=1 Tax=Alcanivorax sp. 24 TaxID=2545266 RepID=UPI00105DB517|nr:MbnP family copper-binding protein [Alcanivorax sp. 24]
MRATFLAIAGISMVVSGCGGSSSSSSTGGGDDINPDVSISIPFNATLGNDAFECGKEYPGIGSNGGNIAVAHDARLFIHNVRFVTNDDREIPMVLDGDDNGEATAQQKPGEGIEGIALLDLRDKGEGCTSDDANPDYNDSVTGTAAIANENIKALRFSVGVPAKYNHIDAQGNQPQLDRETGEPIAGTVAEGPLAASGMGAGGMHWSWAMGYVHARIEVEVPSADAGIFYVHLGSTECDGEASYAERVCANGNRPEVELNDFNPELHGINVNLAALLSGNDITVNQGGPAGCMSGLTDLDCIGIFERLELPFPDADMTGDYPAVFSTFELQ